MRSLSSSSLAQLVGLSLIVGCSAFASPTIAAAGACTGDGSVREGLGQVIGAWSSSCDKPPSPVGGAKPGAGKGPHHPTYAELVAKRKAAIIERANINKAAILNYQRCTSLTVYTTAACVPPKLLGELKPLQDARPGDPAEPELPPETLAYTVLARLKLTAPKPAIGPPPSINPWKIAAVGYPLWLSADGNINPAPVSETAYGATVSLTPHLDRVVFMMGDGKRVTCTNLTRAWHRGIEPGTPSPVCGYRYTKPSLPKGRYTITARSYWSVAYNVNGATGTIPLVQTATTTLPVGELQVVIR